MASKKQYTFKKLTLEEMVAYIEENVPSDKAWFKSIAFEERKQKKSVPQFDTDGNPIMYQVKNKDGTPKVDDSGKPVMRQRITMVEVKGGKTKPVFNLLKAKQEFCKKYMPEILPKAASKKKASDILADW